VRVKADLIIGLLLLSIVLLNGCLLPNDSTTRAEQSQPTIFPSLGEIQQGESGMDVIAEIKRSGAKVVGTEKSEENKIIS